MKTDIAIIGGGPAGSSLALYLAAHGRAVSLVDAGRTSRIKPGEGLIPAAKRILVDLQVWDAFLAQDHLPSYGNDFLWGQSEVQSRDFMQSIDGHGWHLDRGLFDEMLRGKAEEVGAKAMSGFVERVEGEPGKWKLKMRSGAKVECRWWVDATGRPARLARQMGASRQDSDRLVAFFQSYRPGKAGDRYGSSLIESHPEGWWYNALLPTGQRLVYFFTDADLPVVKQVQSQEGFNALLADTQMVGAKLQEYDYVGEGTPQSADARSARLSLAGGDHWLAVGDAAVSFDPLSSQGIMTALYGGLRAGQALVEDESTAATVLGQDLDRVWDHFSANRLNYYQTESRYRTHPFWQRRFSS